MSGTSNGNNAKTDRLDPITKDTVKRIREKAHDLTNDKAGETKAIGEAVAELCHLTAHLVEAQPLTKENCEENRQSMKEYIDERVKDVQKGVNWPTALTIIATLSIFGGIAVKIVQAVSG